jgi:tetratricopeptide (TPR) repeat protein
LDRGALPAGVDAPLRLSTALAALQTAIQLGKFDATDRLIALVSRQQGQDRADDVTQAFFLLATRMRDQLDKLQAMGNVEGGRQMEESYETFLDKLADRTVGQNLQSLAFLGNAYIELRRFDKAQTALDKALDLARGANADPAALARIRAAGALCLSGRGKHDEAVQAIDTLAEASPNVQEVLFARGKILMAAGRLKEAEAHWARIIRGTARTRPPHYYEALAQLTETYLLHAGAPRKAALAKGARNLGIVLERSHPTLTPAWRERLQRLLHRVESG